MLTLRAFGTGRAGSERASRLGPQPSARLHPSALDSGHERECTGFARASEGPFRGDLVETPLRSAQRFRLCSRRTPARVPQLRCTGPQTSSANQPGGMRQVLVWGTGAVLDTHDGLTYCSGATLTAKHSILSVAGVCIGKYCLRFFSMRLGASARRRPE